VKFDGDGLEDGQFIGYASIFGNIDSYGDVMMPGAFANTLAEWEKSGNSLPVLYGHNMMDPEFNIGHVLEAAEDETGLKVRSQLDLDSPKGAAAYRGVKGKRISQMSFAYDVVRGGPATRDGVDVFEIHEVKLYEVSLVLIGANQETSILAVKAAAEAVAGGVKEGRVLSAKHVDSLRNARDSIDAVLSAAEPITEQEKASGNGAPVKDEAAAGRKSEDPAPNPSARTLTGLLALEADLIAAGV
jgi:HK97 family phage prohead protease